MNAKVGAIPVPAAMYLVSNDDPRMNRPVSWLRTVGLVAAILIIAVVYQRRESATIVRKVGELQKEKAQLVEYVQRLSASRRVAQVGVLARRRGEDGLPVTTLRWQEFTDDGLAADPVELSVIGTQVYVEAMVIKFEHDLVARGDAPQGGSLAMFRRVFGDRQPPESAPPLVPELAGGRSTASDASNPQLPLWDRFWELVESPQIAQRYGIRVAQCEAPAVRVRPGDLWEVTLDAAGGLNLRRLHSAVTVTTPER